MIQAEALIHYSVKRDAQLTVNIRILILNMSRKNRLVANSSYVYFLPSSS